MSSLYLLITVAGIALIAWGLPASHRLRAPLDVLASLAVLAGVVGALLGVLLFVAPGFFQG